MVATPEEADSAVSAPKGKTIIIDGVDEFAPSRALDSYTVRPEEEGCVKNDILSEISDPKGDARLLAENIYSTAFVRD